ncbi:MAG TPA: transglutaminase-like domain-containing protein [Chthoniobacteraceae bacterium]|nr:transglutaminase-like domain-containing protein [Chthoniobacteraceae bacterium]
MPLQQKEAIVKLLSDDDPLTVNLVKEELISQGAEASGELQKLLAEENDNVRRHVTQVLAEIDAREAAAELSLLCPLFHDDGDIEHANWLLARALLPGVPVAHYKRMIDDFGSDLSTLLRDTGQPRERIGIIAAYLGIKQGFRGNAGDYYDPSNSLLPGVLESRMGIPISLTLLYMLAGARAGMKIEGVNLPGHFLARHEGVIFDPFGRGRLMTLGECNEILARQKLAFNPEHVEVASNRVMLRRILTNLLYVFQNEGEEARAKCMAEWIHGLERD